MEYLDKFVHKDYIEKELKYSELYHYLDRYMNKDIFVIEDLKANKGVRQNGIIWIFWLQGMESAPKIVRKCYESVCRNKPDGLEVLLLTEKNLDEYIQLPDYIWQKYKEGYISVTHLSDIVRLELLCTYGGCWVDATVFCSGTIPEYMVKRDIFFFRATLMDRPVIKMSSWWVSADRHNRIIQAARKMIHAYWANEYDIQNYFLLHIVMSKIIDEDSACHAIFSSIPYFNNSTAHVLQRKLAIEYDEKEWEIIKDISPIHKLTYKKRYLKGDIYNFYMALMDGKLDIA